MGDRTTWYRDCPNCGNKGSVECYEQLSSNLKMDDCEKCDYTLRYDIADTKDAITVTTIYPNLVEREDKA